MKYGLSLDNLESIIEVLRKSERIEKAVLFGSRAKGNYKPGSDIDIAVYGKNISFDDFLTLKLRLDELELLNKIDLVKFESIENPEFIDHINRVGICIYQKASNGR
jgi:predicted nucleotidyltransferase